MLLHFVSIFALVLTVPFVRGECLTPAVRREWRSISETERADWISAFKCLAKLPHNDSLVQTQDPWVTQIPPINASGSLFDDFSFVHMDLNPIIHHTGLFLPWHRAYVHSLELAMKEKCGYTGAHPYWDWTMDASNFYNSSIFDPSLTSGFGGWGDPNDDIQVTTGAFSYDFIVSYPSPHRVRRNFTLQPWIGDDILYMDGSTTYYNTSQVATDLFTPASQAAMVNGSIGDFTSFQAIFEGISGSHNSVHRIIGGDMSGSCPANSVGCIYGNKWSPNDPLFFMHHAMVDKLWYDWQHKHPANFWSYRGGADTAIRSAGLALSFPNGAPPFLNLNSPIPGDGILPNFTIFETMNTTGGKLCYVYE